MIELSDKCAFIKKSHLQYSKIWEKICQLLWYDTAQILASNHQAVTHIYLEGYSNEEKNGNGKNLSLGFLNTLGDESLNTVERSTLLLIILLFSVSFLASNTLTVFWAAVHQFNSHIDVRGGQNDVILEEMG